MNESWDVLSPKEKKTRRDIITQRQLTWYKTWKVKSKKSHEETLDPDFTLSFSRLKEKKWKDARKQLFQLFICGCFFFPHCLPINDNKGGRLVK